MNDETVGGVHWSFWAIGVVALGIASSTIDFSPFDILMIILMPLVVAAFLIWYPKWAESKGWIT